MARTVLGKRLNLGHVDRDTVIIGECRFDIEHIRPVFAGGAVARGATDIPAADIASKVVSSASTFEMMSASPIDGLIQFAFITRFKASGKVRNFRDLLFIRDDPGPVLR